MSQVNKFVNYILFKCVGDLEVNKQFSSKGKHYDQMCILDKLCECQ